MDSDDTITVRAAITLFTRETTRLRAAIRQVAAEFRDSCAEDLSRAELDRYERLMLDETEAAISEARQAFKNLISEI